MVLLRTHVLGAARVVPLGALVLVLPACQTEVFGGKDNFSPAVEQHDYAQEKIDAGGRKGGVYGPNQRDPGAAPVVEFTAALMAFQPKPASVACLPLVSLDLKTNKPWVSELGVETTDAVARALRDQGFSGTAFATDDMSLRLAQTNVSRSSLTSLESVAANAERLGADVLVFGTIRRRDRVGALDRSVLTCELQAYDVAGRRIATSTRWEIPSDEPNFRRVWDLAQTESAWMPDSRYAPPGVAPTLTAELQRITDDLAGSLAKTVDSTKFDGSVYVAPLDVSAFAPELAMLRSAQSAYASEMARRIDAAKVANAAVDMSGTIVLAGTEFANLQVAEAYLEQLSEGFQATNAARLARVFGADLADALRKRTPSWGRSISDIASVSPADRSLVAGELAQGGVARTAAVREVLSAAGIGLVVVPRLEKIGDALQIRAEALDVGHAVGAGSARVAIPAEFVSGLRGALAPDPNARPSVPTPAAPSGQPSGGTWGATYESVKSGVVHVAGSTGRGSGFVVRDGLVLTNHHVATGIGDSITVTAEGGKPLPARVVASDSYWDLAALQVDGLPESCHVFTFADEVRVGTAVAVLGHPKDSSGWVLTPGYVSSTREHIDTPDGRERAALMYTSATRQGSSGSPVLLADGRVAAVHSAGRVGQSLTDSAERTELTGFALGTPAHEARLFTEKIARP